MYGAGEGLAGPHSHGPVLSVGQRREIKVQLWMYRPRPTVLSAPLGTRGVPVVLGMDAALSTLPDPPDS